ncbi:hypothetical protein ABZ593_21040 [Streptomyces sp. NPDC012617]|uniref:hypothetical protein n=1 Tax=Streptomyces TaxID=1883 RepID=UPI0033EBB6EB
MSSEFTDTHPFPDVILREYPPANARPEERPTFHVFVTGWRYGGNYKTHAGARRAAERAHLSGQTTTAPVEPSAREVGIEDRRYWADVYDRGE